MAVYFFDTSAIVKRYVAETGSGWVQTVTDPASGHDIYVIGIAGPEAISAFVRQTPNLANLASVLFQFKSDFYNQYQRLTLTDAVIVTAMRLGEVHRLRGYDAVQLAAAVELQSVREAMNLPALVFVSADQHLNSAAAAESLLTDDPNAHP